MAEKGIQILLIEDNEEDAFLIQRALRKVAEPLSVNHVTNLSDAESNISQALPDLILTDLGLQETQGLATFEKLKSFSRSLPVVVLSGLDDQEIALKAVRKGAQDYLTKEELSPFVLGKSILHSIERSHLQDLVDREREKSVNASRLASLGQMAGGVAHEINNPLTIIFRHIEMIEVLIERKQIEPRELLPYVDGIRKTCERIMKVVQGMQVVARDGGSDKSRSMSINQMVEHSLSICREKFKSQEIDLQVIPIEGDDIIEGREVELSQVLINLLNNAYAAVKGPESAWVKVESIREEEQIKICIMDSGSGVPKEYQSQIFDPFFTTKTVGEGTGLGLSISKGIVSSHGGNLRYVSEEPHTTIEITRPIRKNKITV